MNSAATRYVQRSQVVTAPLGLEMALLEMRTGSYLAFNETATAIWNGLEEPRTIEQICDALSVEFQVDRDRSYNSVERIIDELQELGLLQSVGG